MKYITLVIIISGALLTGCSDQEPFPVGIGSERNELKRTFCSDKEKCREEAFYRHGRFIQK
jgi:hypothetical protein